MFPDLVRLTQRKLDVNLITPTWLQLQLLPCGLDINLKYILILLTDSYGLNWNNLIQDGDQNLVLPRYGWKGRDIDS